VGSPFLVLDLRFYIVNGVRRLHLEGDSLSREGLDEYLHLVLSLKLYGNTVTAG